VQDIVRDLNVVDHPTETRLLILLQYQSLRWFQSIFIRITGLPLIWRHRMVNYTRALARETWKRRRGRRKEGEIKRDFRRALSSR
jgi:hypothetical protein